MSPSPRHHFPSSPEFAWSPTGSSDTHDHSSPPTPRSCFSPLPTIVSPDEFALLVQDGSPISPPVPSSETDPCHLFRDDISKARVLLRNASLRENIYDRFESSPPSRPRNTPRVPPVSQVNVTDDFPCKATPPTLVNAAEPSDPLRCSLLIHEVSILVGLAPDDDSLLPGDGGPLVPDTSKQVSDILPLSLTPTRSLAPRKHRNDSPPHPTISLSCTPTPSCANPHTETPPSVVSTDLVTPIARRKSPSAVRPSLSPHRRQGQVFHFEPPLNNVHHRHAVDLDETFIHPREPPPKPTLDPSANRCSSLDRLERSLLKLEAYAPSNHRKSQSEGRPSDHVAQRMDKRPSLPPPRRLKKQQSNHENQHRNPSCPAHGRHLSDSPPPVSRPEPLQYVTPRFCPTVPLDDEQREENNTPGSFMDMDIPQAEEALRKRHTSFPSKKKMKSLASVARRLSRGVIAWGKNLTGSVKPSVIAQEPTVDRKARL